MMVRERGRLVAEASGDSDLVAALGAAAIEDSLTGLGGHANEEAVDLAATTAVGLEGALGHGVYPVSDLDAEDLDFEDVCWPGSRGRFADGSGKRSWRGHKCLLDSKS